jgi:hypothetical protein
MDDKFVAERQSSIIKEMAQAKQLRAHSQIKRRKLPSGMKLALAVSLE